MCLIYILCLSLTWMYIVPITASMKSENIFVYPFFNTPTCQWHCHRKKKMKDAKEINQIHHSLQHLLKTDKFKTTHILLLKKEKFVYRYFEAFLLRLFLRASFKLIIMIIVPNQFVIAFFIFFYDVTAIRCTLAFSFHVCRTDMSMLTALHWMSADWQYWSIK